MPPVKRPRYITEFFTYSVNALAIAPAAVVTGQISIQADSDFVVQKLCYFADIAAAAQTDSGRVIPLVTLLITDSGSSRQLMDRPIAIPSLFGIGEVPFILPSPRNFSANSVIQVEFTNFDAAVTYNVRLAFIGHKVYGLR